MRSWADKSNFLLNLLTFFKIWGDIADFHFGGIFPLSEKRMLVWLIEVSQTRDRSSHFVLVRRKRMFMDTSSDLKILIQE